MGAVEMVEKRRNLVKDALVGFALGLLVVSCLAVVTWSSRTPSAQAK
jgi:hypothetical protein